MLLPLNALRAGTAIFMACVPLLTTAADTSPAQQLAHWNAQASTAGQAARGQTFFNARHGGEWSCASCHGNPPTTAMRDLTCRRS